MADRSDYLRWSVPSTLLATVSLLLCGYSEFYVQPRITQVYDDYLKTQLEKIGIENPSSAKSDRGQYQGTEAQSTDQGFAIDDMLTELDFQSVRINLRRHENWFNSDDQYPLLLALVSEKCSGFLLSKAKAEDPSQTKVAERERLLAQSLFERRAAVEYMRKAFESNGPNRKYSSLWLAKNYSSSVRAPTGIKLADLLSQLRLLIDDKQVGEDAKRTLAAFLFESALSDQIQEEQRIENLADGNSIELAIRARRLGLVEEANDLLQSLSTESVVDIAMQAEVRWISDPMASSKIAWNGSQKFWNDNNPEGTSIENAIAAMRCMILSGGLKEAQLFAAREIANLGDLEQADFRRRAAVSCIRLVVGDALRHAKPNEETMEVPSEVTPQVANSRTHKSLTSTRTAPNPSFVSRNVALIAFAIQLSPDSDKLVNFLEILSSDLPRDHFLASLATEIYNERDTPVQVLLLTIHGLIKEEEAKREFGTLIGAIKSSPGLGVTASRVAIRLLSQHPSAINGTIAMLREINRSCPELLSVWSDRVQIHMRENQLQEAIECLEYLNSKLPNNEEINSALVRTRKQLGDISSK